MKGDFSRDSFDPRRAYSRVLHQQGRVISDADLNEQAAAHLHLLRTMARDLIGLHGGPAGDAGFEIMLSESGSVLIGAGRYYVAGTMIENLETVAFDAQPHHTGEANVPDTAGRDTATLFYLEVFERARSSFERPDIADPALGTENSSLRLETIWHVRAVDTGRTMASFSDDDAGALLEGLAPAPPLLAFRATPSNPDPDALAASGYLGTENCLFRIEIHRGGGPGEAVYKWSRENGRILSPWHGFDGNFLLLPGVDQSASGCVIELSDASREIDGRVSEMAMVIDAGAGRFRVVAGDIDAIRNLWNSGLERPFARRWEPIAEEARAPGLARVVRGELGKARWIELGDGIQIAFAGDNFRAGDYWQLAVRPGADLLWPGSQDETGEWRPRLCPPAGAPRWRAPLACMGRVQGRTQIRDVRRIFAPATS